jgi:group I intron endonuclease
MAPQSCFERRQDIAPQAHESRGETNCHDSVGEEKMSCAMTMETASIELHRNPALCAIGPARECGIYAFIHRETGRCYVGSTNDFKGRLTAHLNAAKNGSKTCFHSALRKYGVSAFDFEQLEICSQNHLLARERFYIVLLNAASINGFNTREYPDERTTRNITQATRDRIGQSSKGRYFSPEVRFIMAQKSRARALSRPPATIGERIRRAIKRKRPMQFRQCVFSIRMKPPLSESHKRAIAEGGRGRVQSESTKSKRAAHHIGVKRTPEQRERMRLAQLNMSPEKKARIDAARHRHRSEECRARMRAGIAAAIKSGKRK